MTEMVGMASKASLTAIDVKALVTNCYGAKAYFPRQDGCGRFCRLTAGAQRRIR